jgi:hypothetical protein
MSGSTYSNWGFRIYKKPKVSEKSEEYGKESKQQKFDFTFKKEKPAKGLSGSKRVRMVFTGRIAGESHKVSSVSDVASLLAHIRKSAQEITCIVAVDKIRISDFCR